MIVIDDSAVDTSVLGTYIVTFTVDDGAGNIGIQYAHGKRGARYRFCRHVSIPRMARSLIAVDTNIQVTFNQPMNAATIDDSHLVVSTSNNGVPPIATVVTWDPGTLTATIDPASDLDFNTTYYVIVENTIENASLEKQGFKVKTSFRNRPELPGHGRRRPG